MTRWSLNEIANAVGGKIENEQAADVLVTGVQFDSRNITNGDLFVPIVADRDGHSFLQSAIDNGAAATFWAKEKNELPQDLPAIVVEDTFKALQQFAKWYLKEVVNPKVVGITGSNGKTTTKDMTEAVLSSKYKTHKTQGNYNNQIGLPMTILQMPRDTEVAILEMGMDRPKEINALSELAEPDVAVITMIGESHIEFFGTRAAIADAKTEILDGLSQDGLFIYNGDEPLLNERAPETIRSNRFGLDESNDYYAFDVESGMKETSFTTNLNRELKFTLPTPGEHNVSNALAAIGVGLELDVSLEQAATALKSYQLTKDRLEWIPGIKDTQILNDAYNASPSSMKVVLDYFSNIDSAGRKIVVLGDMRELGDLSKDLHESLATSIVDNGFDQVVLYGPEMGALNNKLSNETSEKVKYFEDSLEDLTAYLKDFVSTEDLILVKSSFGTDLLSVVKELRK